ncbi:MAG: hypothetical protein A2275_12715 [Bacteroidetes bacterium RIFOXYA12_FULL_35_11]|nr:MAG: hypothetical protein A2X01_03105 [Bacteroidetes bacterium GWF2_35_48]OFY76498.1 MAG: hypothetical protein A2275_12715 [Bacteroidetes bacterium RIFOXYA12_FULL_35_11]OFY95661.1 MAG: hypothetical protein A2309_05165 [Bacteroidetes bacterium RIFOXYB2_FULL_35_7]OFY99961.1 MAG: hypothetical protein A2491_13145 [Bacteroidetes bacterium RIFOXYC12_FULL_35_7]HBX51411.1 hypothetical protein [Bacteroidales bacterium]
MKKVLFSLFALGLVSMLSFNSCNKANTSTSEPVAGTATIKGVIKADINLDGTDETVPAGTKVIAQINAVDLIDNPTPGYNYGKIQYETTTSSIGEYSISVAAGTKSVSVNLICDDIIAGSAAFPRIILTGPTASASVVKNNVQIIDMNY